MLALVVFGMTANAKADTVYASPSGRDGNPGTFSSPVASPQKAVEIAKPGDTVFLRGGRYSINRFIRVSKPDLTIASYPGETAEITAPTNNESLIAVIVIVANNVSLLNLNLSGSAYYGVKIDASKESHTSGVLIRGCRIHDTGRDCVKTLDADGLTIEGCEIGPSGVRDPSNAEGIDSIGSVGITIRNCYIHDSATNGIYLKGGARDGLIESCRIERTHGYAGIILGQDTDLEFMRDGTKFEAINCVARNNVIAHTGAAGLGTYSGSNIRFENNTLYDVASEIQAGFWVVTNSRDVPAENVSFVNNIVVINSGRPFAFIKDLSGPLTADGNIYYSPKGNYEFRREISSRSQPDQWNFAQWKRGEGVDRSSYTENPRLDPASMFRPQPGSPAIGRGVAATEVKNDFAGSPRPQTGRYTIGAFEPLVKDAHNSKP